MAVLHDAGESSGNPNAFTKIAGPQRDPNHDAARLRCSGP
jgi:hypothetical protein